MNMSCISLTEWLFGKRVTGSVNVESHRVFSAVLSVLRAYIKNQILYRVLLGRDISGALYLHTHLSAIFLGILV